MLLFWLLAAVMLALALVLVLPPLLSDKTPADSGEHEQVASNVAMFQERMEALEAEHAAGEMDDESFAEAKLELQRELLHDAGSETPAPRPARTGASPVAATLVAALLPLITFGIYLRLGDMNALDPEAAAAPQSDVAAAHSRSGEANIAQVEQMVANLASRLQQEPDDGEGWYMLARSYSALGRYEPAADAFARAHAMMGDLPDLLVDWAEAVGMASGETLVGRPSELIDRALQLQPDNAKGLWLGGFAALQNSQPALAVERFQRVQQLLPPGSEARDAVTTMLAEMGVESAAPAAPAGAQAAGGGASLSVEVSLAPELAGRLQGDENLFVFARAAEGPRIPLAVVRTTAAALPLSVTLDESQAMQPGMTIASFPQVVVGARLTRGGQPTASSGDLEGFSQPVTVGEGPVKVVIDQVGP